MRFTRRIPFFYTNKNKSHFAKEIVSALALIILYPALASFAQKGINLKRTSERDRTGEVVSCTRSTDALKTVRT